MIFGIVFHEDGNITVLEGHAQGRFGGATRALNQANKACGPNDTYTAVEADNEDDALKKAKAFQ
jgi:hypothetical protein